jgi:hypothetical protein
LAVIVVRFMDVSLGHARIEVNTQRHVKRGKGLRTIVMTLLLRPARLI